MVSELYFVYQALGSYWPVVMAAGEPRESIFRRPHASTLVVGAMEPFVDAFPLWIIRDSFFDTGLGGGVQTIVWHLLPASRLLFVQRSLKTRQMGSGDQPLTHLVWG